MEGFRWHTEKVVLIYRLPGGSWAGHILIEDSVLQRVTYRVVFTEKQK
jgi:hypothetical protein